MSSWIAIAISSLAFLVSAVTVWLTLFKQGKLRMTQPTVIFFGPDGSSRESTDAHLKVFLRTLLYSTSRQGQIVESMHVEVQRSESKQNFSVWVYGDTNLARGSGLFVGMEGVACNHHFLLPKDGADFKLLEGRYLVRVFAKIVRDREPRQLAQVALSISETQAQQLALPDAGIYFDWGPDQQEYHAHIEVRKPKEIPTWFFGPAS